MPSITVLGRLTTIDSSLREHLPKDLSFFTNNGLPFIDPELIGYYPRTAFSRRETKKEALTIIVIVMSICNSSVVIPIQISKR